MIKAELQLSGIDEARSRLTNLAVTLSGYGRTVYVGSSLPYAYGQETGRHRVSGKVARRAGPSYFLTFAAQDVLDQATPDVLRGLEQTASGKPRSGLGQVRRLARWVGRLARQSVPYRTGRLRRSIRTVVAASDGTSLRRP